MSKGEPILYDDALRIAKKHLINIGMIDSIEKIVIVGSLRRKEKEVRDIDYQIIAHYDGSLKRSGRYGIEDYFGEKRGWRTIEAGSKRAIYQAPSGLYFNCFYTEREHWGAALMHNTGPRTYNIRKRYLIKKRGGILNQYGLYMPPEGYEDDEVGLEYITGKTEQEIYDALGWAYCKPEDRV